MNITRRTGSHWGHWLDEKRLVVIHLTIAATIMLGYLFLLSWVTGFLVSKYAAGKSAGEPGKVRSLVIPFRKRGFHLHHWLYSLCLIGLSLKTGIYILTPTITYGLFGGLIFQGIYCYSDWHVILINRHKTGLGERLDATCYNLPVLNDEMYVKSPSREVELVDLQTMTSYISEMHDILREGSLTERRAFVRSIIKEIKVLGDQAVITYSLPIPPEKVAAGGDLVPRIVQCGGAEGTIGRTFELAFTLAI
jgi:hypothetical protein